MNVVNVKKTHQNPNSKQVKVPQEVQKCDDCGKTFKMMHKYREHIKNRHKLQFSKVYGGNEALPSL